jgi:hypothetical protein
MKHRKNARFRKAYDALPAAARSQADKSFALLKQNPSHPSLHFKKVGRYWSVRVALGHRALAVEVGGDLVWFWIGSHAEYDGVRRN